MKCNSAFAVGGKHNFERRLVDFDGVGTQPMTNRQWEAAGIALRQDWRSSSSCRARHRHRRVLANITRTGIETAFLSRPAQSRGSGVRPPVSSARPVPSGRLRRRLRSLLPRRRSQSTSSLGMPKGPGEQVKGKDQNNQITKHSYVNISPASQKRLGGSSATGRLRRSGMWVFRRK